VSLPVAGAAVPAKILSASNYFNQFGYQRHAREVDIEIRDVQKSSAAMTMLIGSFGATILNRAACV
jgi:hypothetical protein